MGAPRGAHAAPQSHQGLSTHIGPPASLVQWHPEHHRCLTQHWRSGCLATALLLFPWDPALLSLPRNCPENSLFPPGAPALPMPALENAVGLRSPWEWGSCMEPRGSMEAGWVPPGRGHCGARGVTPPPPQPNIKLSSATNLPAAVRTGSKQQASMPKPNPRAGRAPHSLQVFLQQTVRPRVPPPQHCCPSPGSASPPSDWAGDQSRACCTLPGFCMKGCC